MLTDPFLTKQLFAYIGNKRSLLPFLSDVFDGLELGTNVKFSDPFAGSGSVSRLGKHKGFQVFTNDWEHYSYVVNSCYIGINQDEANGLFNSNGGIEEVFNHFNNLSGDYIPYISKHYAPKDTNSADYVTERLFYTKENGLFIDRARTEIDAMYPADCKEKNILLASLLYEVSTHANTSGVFKACHKGFGGHGKDALGRIMAPMKMEIPNLINSSYENTITRLDALDFVKGITTDICYLDPPYNMHQYGSNYFMLNTVALWDRPEVNQKRGTDGRFVEKAGIRKDWKNTKSPYCYKSLAPASFENLMNSIDSRYIILSYNTEGIIPFDQLFDIMEKHGRVNLHVKDYVLYKGGRQSVGRKTHNMELLLVVDRNKKADGKDRVAVERFLKERRILNQLRMPFEPTRLDSSFNFKDPNCILNPGMEELKTFKGYKFIDQPTDLGTLSDLELKELFSKLSGALCSDNLEEIEVLISLLEKERDIRVVKKVQKRLLVVYKKIAFKKYIDMFNEITGILNQKIKNKNKNFVGLVPGVLEIQSIAKLRFEG